MYVQCDLSKPSTLETKEKLWFREVYGLERFYIKSMFMNMSSLERFPCGGQGSHQESN